MRVLVVSYHRVLEYRVQVHDRSMGPRRTGYAQLTRENTAGDRSFSAITALYQ